MCRGFEAQGRAKLQHVARTPNVSGRKIGTRRRGLAILAPALSRKDQQMDANPKLTIEIVSDIV